MNAILFNNDTIRLEITREELHTVRDALLESVEHLEDGIAKREQLISKLAGADPGEIAEALEETGLEDSLEDLQRGLKRDQNILSGIQDFSKALEEFVLTHDLARYL